MPRTVTLAQMRTRVQTRGSYENSADITPTLIDEFINEALSEVWDLLVGKWEDYYVTRVDVAVVADPTEAGLALPADFYKMRKLEIYDSSVPSGFRHLHRHDLDSSHLFTILTAKRFRYRLQGGRLYLAPVPVGPDTLRLFYVPCAPVLAADGDTFDGVNGYEELVYHLALKRCYDRQELPTNSCDVEIDRLTKRIKTAADSRDTNEPYYLNPDGYGSSEDDNWGWY